MSTKHPPITGELRAAMEHAEGARDGRTHRTCEARRFETSATLTMFVPAGTTDGLK